MRLGCNDCNDCPRGSYAALNGVEDIDWGAVATHGIDVLGNIFGDDDDNDHGEAARAENARLQLELERQRQAANDARNQGGMSPLLLLGGGFLLLKVLKVI